MLPTEYLIHRFQGETIVPKALTINQPNLELAQTVVDCFTKCINQTQKELDYQLLELEGNRPDFKIIRGLGHILKTSFSSFNIVSPLEPATLRSRVFSASANCPSFLNTQKTLDTLAQTLSLELNREVLPIHITNGLYADLIENKILTQFDPPSLEGLLHRYNLSQVQGIFYKVSDMLLHAYRNVPGEYKLLFRYLKLFQLMFYIEGDADHGFTITIDGPISLFKPTTRYGLALAKMIPALLHVTKWSLSATLKFKDPHSKEPKTGRYTLNSNCDLVSHYLPGSEYDSLLEESFASRWRSLKTLWVLEREVELIPIPGSVMIPDFRLVHPDGRTISLEIIGYWRPEYLQKKFSQVRWANPDHIILAISERLNLDKAGIKVKDLPFKIVWFKDKLSPKAVLQVLEPT